MSIGNLDVKSSLGEPLQVRVAVTLDSDAAPIDNCFHLAGPSSRSALLRGARVELATIGGKRYVLISTATPVTDPILDLGLRSHGCGANMQKDFVILLSPPAMARNAPMASAGPVASPPTPVAAQAATKPRPRHRARAGGHLASTKPAARRHNGSHPEHFVLRLDYSFDSLSRFADQVAKRRQMENEAPPVRANAQGHDRLVVEGDSELPAAVTAPAETLEGVADTTSAVAPPSPSPSPRAVGQHGGVGSPLPPEAAQPRRSPPGSLFSPFNLGFFAFLVTLVLLVAWWLKWRTPKPQVTEETTLTLDEIVPPRRHYSPPIPAASDRVAAEPEAMTQTTAPSEPPKSPTASPTGDDTLELVPAGNRGVPPAEALPAVSPPTFSMLQSSDIVVDQGDSIEDVLELAEVMLAFGRGNQAIETLSHFISSRPNQAIDPWLRLLELYYKANSRGEFDALATDLHRHFNVEIPDWGSFGNSANVPIDNAPALTLESLPHIMDRLTATWGTPECLAYLDRLLADNRGGQRHGFSLPLVRDILLLRDILRENEQVTAVAH